MDYIQITLIYFSVVFLTSSISYYYKRYDFWSQFYCDLERPKKENTKSIIFYIVSMVIMGVYYLTLPSVVYIPNYQLLFNGFAYLCGISCICFAFFIYELTPKTHLVFAFIFMSCLTAIITMIAVITLNIFIIIYLIIHIICLTESLFALMHEKPLRVKYQAIAQKIQSISLVILLIVFHIF